MVNCCVIPVLTNSSPNYLYFLYFFLGICILIISLPLTTFRFVSFKIFKFRSQYTEILKKQSPHIGQKSPNTPSNEKKFKQGDLVLLCPVTKKPFSIRNWRNLRCTSGLDPKKVQYNWCYQYNLPAWLRRMLYELSSKKEDEKTGTRWLCNCAGDKEGY